MLNDLIAIGWAVAEHRVDDMLNYRTRAPEAVANHPTEEHLLLLFVALGASNDCELGASPAPEL